MSCDFWCFVALPHGLVGWSAVCDWGISWSYSLTFYLLSSYWSIFLIKIQQKSGIGVIRGVGVIMQFLEHKSCGILTRTVWSIVVGHVVLAIHIVHSLETNRVGPIPRQILVVSEHSLFTWKGKGTWNIPILHRNSLDYAYLVSFLTVPCRVGLQSVIVAFLRHTLSFLKL